MLSRKLFFAITAAGLLAAPALAQVAPPPPPAEESEPEFVPPPMPQAKPAPKRTEFKQTPSRTKVDTSLPEIPHPGLWEFCGTEDPEVDEVCQFEDNLHYVALRPNPTISPGMIPRIQQVIVARRARFEEKVMEHLAVAIDVDGGLIENVSITDPEALSELLETVQPLTPPTNFTQELQNREVLTKTMAKFNNKIIGDYQRAYGAYLRRAYPDDATDRFMRAMFKDSLVEAMQAYEGLLHESRLNIDGVLAKIEGVPANAASALRALKMDDMQVSRDEMRASAEAVKLAWRPLTLEQKRQYLAAVRTFRAVEHIPPVPTIDVMWAGKKIIENKPGVKALGSARVKIENDEKESD